MQNTNYIIQSSKVSQWSMEDLAKLEKDYVSGKKLKTIAFELGRSISAINKFITRAGIRKNTVSRIKTRSPINNETKKHNTQEKTLDVITNEFKRQVKNRMSWKKHNKQFSFKDVIKYLRDNGFAISSYKNSLSREKDNIEIFFLNNKAISKSRLLVTANKHRIENNLPIFYIKEFTYY